MDSNDAPRRPSLHNSSSNHSLSRISIVSDITDYNWYSDDYQSPTAGRRASLVSLQSSEGETQRESEDVVSPLRNGSPGWSSFSSGNMNSGYETVPASGSAPKPARKPSRGFSFSAALKRPHETIPEEEDGIDMGHISLIQHAEPIGGVEDDADMGDQRAASPPESGPPVDYSVTLGPSTVQDEEFMKRLQEHEAQGKLTGGIGLGIQTEATLNESQLLATSPVADRAPRTPISRSFSLARNKPDLGRAATLKRIGQDEANKSGKVIEVIIEEEPPTPIHHSMTDLSSMSGPAGLNQYGMRQTTFPTNTQRKEVFYPQPNWKPFSMRWPYLLSLIILSVALACVIEVIYQSSAHKPLMTFHKPSDIPPAEYFAFKFLPTIISVSYGILWQITDFEVKRLEAFYQLSKEGGALAAESINVDYITHWNFLRPFRAFYCKHYAVVVSSVATLLANALVPTLGAASIILSPSREERLLHPLNEKSINISPIYSRILTVTLFVIALLGTTLFYQLQSRKSGLLADVKGIAGLASMAVVSHILMDFKDMDVATHNDIHHRLKSHRYLLRNSSLAPDDEVHPISPSNPSPSHLTKSHLSSNPHPLMLRAPGAIPFLVGLALFLALIPIFLFTPATILTDRAPWVVTALAVCVKLGWGSLETDVRLMEPYYILSRRHAPPKTLTLDYTAMPFGWVAAAAAANRHWLVFSVGFGSVLAELFTVLATSLATVEGRDFIAVLDGNRIHDPDAGEDINAGQETAVSFWASLGIAVAVLAYMFVTALVVFIRRRKVFLPRQPNTIASVLAFIHQSKMLYDFVGTAKLDGKQMGKRLDDIGKTYGLGWFRGRDGLPHLGVDEEELLSVYRFGMDYSLATNPWEERPVEWL